MLLFSSRKKGFSLAEVVISLGVTATVMVVAISLTSQSLRLTKENEVENTANEILIQSLELVKSPVPLNIQSSITGDKAESALAGSYSVAKSTNLNISDDEVGTSYLKLTNPTTSEITADSCKPGSAAYSLYKVDLKDSPAVVCNQIILNQVSGESTAYRIVSIIVYDVGGESVTDRVEAFRKDNFNIVAAP